MINVIKLGGSRGVLSTLERVPVPRETFLDDVATLEEPFVLVHGANAELDELTRRLGQEPRLVTAADGQVSRFTDEATMDLFLMAYCGKVNKRITEGLWKRGRKAIGLSGMDGGIVRGRRKPSIRIVENGKKRVLHGDYAGTIEAVDTALLCYLLDQGYIPVLTPPAVSHEGEAINVDGDKMAMALAIALHANRLLIFSDTPGFLRDPGDERTLITSARVTELDNLLQFAQGRMKKKILACRGALERGVGEVILADARLHEPVHAALAGAGTHLFP
jgi:acetylglutamate/LysW-gamma-L-alpha-aminoadipate kinase